MKLNHKAFGTIEIILAVVLVVGVGVVGYSVYKTNQANKQADSLKSSQTTHTQSTVKEFASCKKAVGSKLLETYPEQCVTKDGKKFTDTSQSSSTSNGVDHTTLSKAPAALKTAVVSYAKANNLCINNNDQFLGEEGNVVADPLAWVVANKAATVAVCQTRQLYAYTNAQWQYLSATQDLYPCNLLEQYHVPAALIGADAGPAQCVDASNNGVDYSD